MGSDWHTALLGDLTVNHDGKRKPVKESDRRPGPYPYYGASGIVDYVDGYLFDGDYLLVAEDGENLRTRQTPIAFMARGKSWVNNHAHIVTGNDRADTRFLMYAIAGTDTSGYLTGAVMPKLTQGNLNKIELNCPPLCEQRAIAHILGTLDDRIELNRQQNETLEAMARALFKAWFVDFEPVRAKMEGRWQRGQSLPGLPGHLYDVFPDRLVESELGEIPEGWQMRSLDSIANYLNGLALQKFPPESETEFLPVIKIAQLRSGNTSGAYKASTQIKPEYVVVNGDVLFSWSGSLEVEVWNGGRGALNQHLFKVTSSEVPKWFYFFATRHHLSNFRAIAAGKATTMGHIQRKHLTDARIAVAPPESMKRFDAVIASQFDQLVSNAQQSHSLAQLRDTLLPKLISGDLRVGAHGRAPLPPVVPGAVTHGRAPLPPVVPGAVTQGRAPLPPVVPGAVTQGRAPLPPVVPGAVTQGRAPLPPVVPGAVTHGRAPLPPVVPGAVTQGRAPLPPVVPGAVTHGRAPLPPVVPGAVTHGRAPLPPVVPGAVTHVPNAERIVGAAV